MVMGEDGQRSARFLWRCHACKKQFTVRIGTVFEDSRIPLRHWCRAFWRACSSKKGISALQISRECNLSYKSALFLMHRIRFAMEKMPEPEKLSGTVEVDETYVGGKTHRGRKYSGWGTKKPPVLAIIQRQGEARAIAIPNVTAKTLKREIVNAIDLSSSRLCTDELKSYTKVGREFALGHGSVMHSAEEYVNGTDHINTCESFFSLLKRKFYGTHHAVSKKHLHRYVSEAAFQWNNRKVDDGQRVTAAISGASGKRLMYRQPVSQPPQTNVAEDPA